jgi:hypothetical protein
MREPNQAWGGILTAINGKEDTGAGCFEQEIIVIKRSIKTHKAGTVLLPGGMVITFSSF